MANSHDMKVNVGYDVSSNGLQGLVEMTEKLNQSSKQAAESLKQIETAVSKINSAGTKSTGKTANSSWLTQQKQMYTAGLQSYDEYSKKVQQKEQQLYKELVNIRNTQGDNSKEFKKRLADYQAYAKSVQQIEKQNTQVINAETKSQNSYRSKELNNAISQYKKLNAEVVKMANSSKSTLGGNYFNSMLSYGALTQVTAAVQDLGRAIVDIQYNTVNNQRLMGDWSTELRDNLNSSAAEIAKSTGIQITDAQQIQGAWIRINDEYAKNADLLGEISDLTAKFMNVGEIEDAEQAVTLLNASLLQMKDSTQGTAQAAEEFLNKWAYMADVTAMGTADEYGTAIARYGAALKNLGGDMDDAIVQSSILADSLAMNGNEAGTALKTFNTYLTRDKTVGLMNDIADATGDVSFRLADANGQLKDYDELIRTVARAYQMYKDQGNDLMANSVLDAVGATRRRDVAIAMLNAVNNGSFDSYYGQLGELGDTNYLEEQNAALMGTLKNQWNALVVSMQQAGMELGNAGILDGITLLVNGAQQAFDAFSSLPQPIQQFVSTLLMVRTASAGLIKLGEITGITEKLNTAFRSGGQAARQMAADMAQSTQGFVDTQKWTLQSATAIDKSTQAYGKAQQATTNYVKSLSDVDAAYANGNISAQEYVSKTKQLTSVYLDEISLLKQTAQENLATAQARYNSAKGTDQEAAAERELKAAKAELTAATNLEKQAIQQAKAAEDQYNNSKKSGIAGIKQRISSAKQYIASLKQEVSAKKQAAIANKTTDASEKASLATRATATVRAIASTAAEKGLTVAKLAGAAASKVAAGAMSLLSTAFGMIFNPMTLVTIGITALSALFGNSKSKVEEYGESLDSLKSELDEVNSKIQELNDLQSQNGGLTDAQQSQLSALEAQKGLLEDQIALTETLKANEEFLNHQGGFLGMGGEDSGLEKAQDALRVWQEASSAFSKAQNDYDVIEEKVNAGEDFYTQNLEQASKNLTEASDAQLDAANELVTQYNELQKLAGEIDLNGDGKNDEPILSGDALEEAKNQLAEMKDSYAEASAVIQQWATEHNVSFEDATAAIEAYNSQLEETESSISKLKSASEGLKEALDIQSQNGVLTLEQTYDLLSKMGDKAPMLAGALEKTEGGYKLNAQAQEIYNQLVEQGNIDTQEAIDLLLKGSEGAIADANAKEQQASSTKKVSDAVQEQKEATEKLTDAQQKLKDAMSNAGMDFSFEKDIKPLTFELNFSGDNAKAQAEQTIGDIRAKIDEVNASNIDPQVKAAQIEYLQQQLGQAVLKKQELAQPAFMDIDVSQATGNMATLVSQLQDYQTLKDQIEYDQAIGVDTTEAEGQLANLASQIQTTLSQDNTLDIGVNPDTDNFQADLDAALGENKVEIDADLVINDDGGAETVEEIKDTINTLPDDKTVDITIATHGRNSLEEVKDNLSKLKGKDIKVTATVSGKGDVETLTSLLKEVKNKDVSISATTNGVGQVNDLQIAINNLEGKSVTVSASVSGTTSAMLLQVAIASVQGKTVNVTAKVSGKDKVDKLDDAIEDVDNKMVVVSAIVLGTSSVNALANAINSLRNRTITITTRNVSTSEVNGTAHAQGTANATGNWGAKQSSTSLVGELGQELVVRGSRWFTVGDKGAEFRNIRKGDIVFNHLQTKELFENGYVTSGGGRGRALVNGTVSGTALASGTAYATGYESSYKITDDKLIANTISVQREAKKAAEAAQRAANASEDAAEELKKAADAAAEAAKEVENLTSEYINNVEDLQGRIADSLKEHYDMEYKEREKILEKEHNARIDSLQKEIDMINGETIEDKESQLADLNEQLAKWSKDDSTLGKKKQKELQDQIADLEKEIKIDKLEQQIEDENKRYDESIDSDSENYDSILKDLDNKMTDKNLYQTANELIKKGDLETIKKLLNEHDAQWDGWETLMGKTAEQIIAEEVKNAYNNYRDVTEGTIYESGGHYTDGVNIPKPTSPSPPASSSSGGNFAVGSTINAGSAPIYAGKGGTGYHQYFANDPVYTVVKADGEWLLVRWHGLSSGLTGYFKKSDVKAYDTGGYTGNDEGLAMLHAKERVLNAQQTAAFEKLVYDFLPRVSKDLLNPSVSDSTVINNNGHTFNSELVRVNIDQVVNNTPYDVENSEDNLDRLFRQSLKRAGITIKR